MPSGPHNPFALLARCSVAVALWCFLLSAEAEDAVDFSCMSHMVRGKTPLTDRYKEYDIVLTNRCPGPVYWTMCIERVDPLSHKILEVHTPAGMLEQEKKSRVNVQMKKGPEDMAFRKRYQEFYLNVGYAIQPPAKTSCVARQCESEIRTLRNSIDANLTAWRKADEELAARMVAECPESGWGKTDDVLACEAAIKEAAQPEIDRLASTDSQLRAQLQAESGKSCQIHAGDLVVDY